MAQEFKSMQKQADVISLLMSLQGQIQKIEQRLDAIEGRLAGNAASAHPTSLSSAAITVSGSSTPTAVSSSLRELMLAPADEQIVSLIRTRGAACAEDVRVNFGYKGKNAASARLNRLFELGILEKAQAGRVVYYRMK